MGLLIRIKDYFIERWYAESFARVANKMENLSDAKKFDRTKARMLIKKYSRLVGKTCENPSLSERTRNSWSVAIAHAYEPSYGRLSLRSFLESQYN